MVKVRFAPSPTGIPHIGNTRTALFNFLFARHNNGKFILRIEDTDRERLVKGSEKSIREMLAWLGISWDEEFRQSDRLAIYSEHAEILRKKGAVYKDEGALRFKIPKEGETSWNDAVGGKKITFKNETQEDFIIIKSDGYPTYNFANVVDDYLMGITHVIRGEEFISSTPKHVQLYRAFPWKEPVFVHLPVILGMDRSKLSKRHGAKSALDYRDAGFLKESIINFIVLLGWNPGGDREQLSLSEIVKLFELKDVNTANAVFDIKKLEWLNGVWIRSLTPRELKDKLAEFYKDDKEVLTILDSPKSELLLKHVGSRMKSLTNFIDLVSQKPTRKKTSEEKLKSLMLSKYLITKLGNKWENEKLLFALKDFSTKEGIAFKNIYFLMTGKEQGIGILELNQIYGKEFFLNNLKNG